ncbi:MAG: hypothetical protein COY53_03630 [Elusimicrobia bacterium CG_4_10_14_0_8_um_filter_37_32]|nr:MAG: hypothetical protein COS17_00335 [Elusimicrobia bacterium CG02_land_8_20_14_3_00_37_13]PIZ13669.1 MAG: hypothetical protein COY53_03630 [Elusimicrobia bacterium CG_4_10_14_0_8_um_filter_37_32]
MRRILMIFALVLLTGNVFSETDLIKMFLENKLTEVTNISEGDVLALVPESVVVSRDGKNAAFIVNRVGKMFLTFNGKYQAEYDHIYTYSLVFSSDSRHFAYAARNVDNITFIMLDRKIYRQESRDNTFMDDSLVFSPNGKRIAYVVKRYNGKYVVVLDKEEICELEEIDVGSIVFSPDSKHVIYIGKQWKEWVVFVNGKPGAENFDEILYIDRKNNKKIMFVSSNTLYYLAKRMGGHIDLMKIVLIR